jgi:hypothetical protein
MHHGATLRRFLFAYTFIPANEAGRALNVALRQFPLPATGPPVIYGVEPLFRLSIGLQRVSLSLIVLKCPHKPSHVFGNPALPGG